MVSDRMKCIYLYTCIALLIVGIFVVPISANIDPEFVSEGVSFSATRDILVESDHPYADNFENTWTIEQPGANQIRIRFKKIDLNSGDKLKIYNKHWDWLTTYDGTYMGMQEYIWTEWETADTLNLELTTNNGGNAYGFTVDQIEYRDEIIPPTEYLAESYHPYANNYQYKWMVEQPDADQIRIRFKRIDLNSGDHLKIYNKQGDWLSTYDGTYMGNREYIWTEWENTDALNLELTTNNGGNAFGFIVDQIEYRIEPIPATQNFAESYHPYANNYQYKWMIAHPGASEMRIHFKRIDLNSGDKLKIYGRQGDLLKTYDGTYLGDKEYIWTEWQTTDTLALELTTNNGGNAYGFVVDLIETEEGVIEPPPPSIRLSLTPPTATVPDGDTMQYSIVMDAAPSGLSSYNFTLSLTKPIIAEITAVDYPNWTSSPMNSELPADSVLIQATDAINEVIMGSTDVTLCTLTMRGDIVGETELTLLPSKIEDDVSGVYSVETNNATLFVTEPSGALPQFTANVTSGSVPLTVQFTDTTSGASSGWNWTFGDGDASSEQNPVHVYTTPGTYSVSLTICGCEECCMKSGYIAAFPSLLLGDATGDGMVNQADTLRVLKEIVGLTTPPLKESDMFEQTDVHHNGVIDIGDAMFIAQFNVGLRDIWFAPV